MQNKKLKKQKLYLHTFIQDVDYYSFLTSVK